VLFYSGSIGFVLLNHNLSLLYFVLVTFNNLATPS
jgi:hypothetical protein